MIFIFKLFDFFEGLAKKIFFLTLKDLSRLNRDMAKVIYIDWEPGAFSHNPDNVLRVPKWEGNMDDTALVDLAELLKSGGQKNLIKNLFGSRDVVRVQHTEHVPPPPLPRNRKNLNRVPFLLR